MLPAVLLVIALLALYLTSREAVSYLPPGLLHLCRKAFLLMKQKAYQEAMETYNAILELKPNHLEALTNRGNTRYFLRDYEGAVYDYSRVIELKPSYSTAYNNRGTTYLALGRIDQALDDFSRAVELNPQLSEAFYNRAGAYSEKGDISHALADLNQASVLNPNDEDILFQRATLLLKSNRDRQLALADLDAFLEYNHSHPRARYLRGLYYLEQGDYQQAIEDFTRSIELKTDAFRPYYRRGICYLEQGDYQQAIEDFTRVIELNPTHLEASFRRGILWLEEKQYQPALDDFDQVLRIVPHSGKAHAFRALARQGVGDMEGAREDLDHYFSTDHVPEDRLAMYQDLVFLSEHLKRKTLLEEELGANLEMTDLVEPNSFEPVNETAELTEEPAKDQETIFGNGLESDPEEVEDETAKVISDKIKPAHSEADDQKPPSVDRLSEMIHLIMERGMKAEKKPG